MFIARTIHAQYRPGVQAPENIAKASEAIEAYQQILQNDPKNDEAYKAIAYLYGAIKEDDKLRDWIHRARQRRQCRAGETRRSYVVLASKDWDCSFKITELPTQQDHDRRPATARPPSPTRSRRIRKTSNSSDVREARSGGS